MATKEAPVVEHVDVGKKNKAQDQVMSVKAAPRDESTPHSIHHVNFPTTDPERTKEWYVKVFGMRHVDINKYTGTKVMLLTRGNFDLHFTPVESMDRLAPYHYAVEVEDWEGFLAHLDKEGIRYTKPVSRPQNNSHYCYIRDPDGTMIELVYHGDRDW